MCIRHCFSLQTVKIRQNFLQSLKYHKFQGHLAVQTLRLLQARVGKTQTGLERTVDNGPRRRTSRVTPSDWDTDVSNNITRNYQCGIDHSTRIANFRVFFLVVLHRWCWISRVSLRSVLLKTEMYWLTPVGINVCDIRRCFKWKWQNLMQFK